jgi:single-strand DNA-binding protein
MALPLVSQIMTVVEDPELRFTPGGKAVCNIRLVCNDRKRNQQSHEWEDGDPFWVTGTAWEQAAENIVNSLHKGDRVLVIGKLRQRTFEQDGVKRMVNDLDIFEIGPTLKWSEATVKRIDRSKAAPAERSEPPAEDTPPF